MNLRDEVDKIKKEGYSEANAEAKICQDIIIKAIAQSSLNRNVTIKGGVVMRGRSKNARRATQDLDLDFIKYSISEESIRLFIVKLNCIEGIHLRMSAPIEELKHQDLDIEQEEYCFDICFQEEAASVLINSREQMITEKLKSLMRFGTRSTRYKDVFDIYYLSDMVDMEKLRFCIQKYIYADTTIDVNDADEIRKRAERIFNSSTYKKQVKRSKKNRLDLSVDEVLKENLELLNKI